MGVVPPRSACSAGETVSWTVVVQANEFSTFTMGRARFDTFANTDCSDDEVDCPSVGEGGILEILPAASATTPTCFGRQATIVGTAADERIEGTVGADVIVGLGGQDIIDGLGGDDRICGNGGPDIINGGPGHDRMDGGVRRDFVTGEDGDDRLLGRRGNDVLNFGDSEDGADLVVGGLGADDLHAGVGADRLFGGPGEDRLAEGEVDAPIVDRFDGGSATDTCGPGTEDLVFRCELPI